MKKFVALGVLCSLLIGADAISAVRGRGGASGGGATTAAASGAVRGRAPVSGTAANTTSAVVPASGATSARAAVRRGATSSVQNVSGGNAVLPGGGQQKVVQPAGRTGARAATNQKAINTNTKIAGATANTVVSEECKTKYYGCMDSFCMLDNTNGGRCICSNKHAEYETILAEIQKLDQQTYEMATTGVERINMGNSAADVDAMVSKITKSMTAAEAAEAKKKARTLRLDAWKDIEVEDEDLFAEVAEDDLTNKTGDALYAAVDKICVKQIPECSGNMNMLKMMYAQQIKSDCGAYENSLKKQKNESAKKLATAQQAMREAALEQYQNANKYDLGQCTLRFKECMQTTAGCGEDFSQCASIVARENAKTKNNAKNKKAQEHVIKTGVTSISVTASTYDTLLGKKIICESVTDQCQKVKDQVWDAFLLDVAPALKSAELAAESDLRMNCIQNISNCFQQACKDTMDPNDPDGSYDMCLSRPDTMRSVCKVQIEPCETAEPQIFEFVKARLASMRVDACTKEVKACLTDDNRCGKDYANCVGLDLKSIQELCPMEKLVGCQEDGAEATWDTIANIVQGIYMNIDNSLLNQCVNIVNAKMTEICGDADGGCDAFAADENMGTESLFGTKRNDGSFEISGLVSFYNVKVKETQSIKFGKYELDINDYAEHLDKLADADSASKERVLSNLRGVQSKINQKIAVLKSDPKVSMCVYGRDMKQIRSSKDAPEKTTARFPNLLDSSINLIINSGLDQANNNYSKKFKEVMAEFTDKQNDEVKTALCAAMASNDKGLKCRQSFLNGKKVCTEYDVFVDQAALGFQDAQDGGYGLKIVLGGMKQNELLKMASKNTSEYITTDSKTGSMLGKITMSAIYSAENNTCNVTTVTQMCKNAKDVYDNVDTKSKCNSTYLGIGGNGCNDAAGGKSGTGGITVGASARTKSEVKASTYAGAMCTSYAEPTTTTQQIKM